MNYESTNVLNKINSSLFSDAGITVYLKRDDLLHPLYGGNKFRKLKYVIKFIQANNIKTVLTFGGAFSNHIAATAFAGKHYGFKTIGIIRGDEFNLNRTEAIANNKTLKTASENGMDIRFVTRQDYNRKHEKQYCEELKTEFGDVFIIPEGGCNPLALKGCAEIVTEISTDFNYIVTAVGTGTTLVGITTALATRQKAIGIEVYKSKAPTIEQLVYLKNNKTDIDFNKIILKNYAFNGYGKTTIALNNFCENFINDYQIPIEPIYTGKMLYGLFDLAQQGFFEKGSVVIALHTGGLQYL